MSPADRAALLNEGGVPAAVALGKYVRRKETEEQRVFNAWLKNKFDERKVYSINPRSDKATTIRKGHPDYTIWLPGARMLLLEMKVDGGVLSPEQIQCIELLSDLGFAVELPGSASEAIQSVRKFL
jgi:hypothetical protein